VPVSRSLVVLSVILFPIGLLLMVLLPLVDADKGKVRWD
jgi:hypothetical protein